MQLRTILNRVYKLPGFVYGKIRLVEREGGQAEVEVEVLPRANGRARCSGCGEPGPCYDRRERRRYQFVPVLGLPTGVATKWWTVEGAAEGSDSEEGGTMVA